METNPLDWTPPEVMVALDLNTHWRRFPGLLLDKLKRAGCRHYKVHDPLPNMDMEATVRALQKAVLPGLTVDLLEDGKELDTEGRVVDAVRRKVDMGFTRVTVHVRSDPRMLEALAKADLGKHVVAVLTLTSEKDSGLLRVFGKTRGQLDPEWVKIASDCGVEGGIVCGAPDVPSLRPLVPRIPFLTPGIYLPEGEIPLDQYNTATPEEASRFGASILISGRSIVGSERHPCLEPEKRFLAMKRAAQSTVLQGMALFG